MEDIGSSKAHFKREVFLFFLMKLVYFCRDQGMVYLLPKPKQLLVTGDAFPHANVNVIVPPQQQRTPIAYHNLCKHVNANTLRKLSYHLLVNE